MVNYNIMPSIGQVAILATSLMGLAESHMFMAEPKPLEGYASKDPLDPSGSNFACKGADLSQYTSGGQKLTAGESFPFKLELGGGANTAVHGGGSCQISLFYGSDSEKAKDPKNWQVIYSIEGGCPANTKGNLGETGAVACKDDKEGDCVHSWDIPMPKGVKSGNAILSWTWFNTVGNREMYQNCASVDIQGGSGDEMNSFPPLFVANLASVDSQCKTEEDSDVLFPSPGKYVTTMSATNGFNHPKATPAGCGGSGGAAPSGYSGPSATSAPAYTGAPAYTSAPAASSAPAAPSAGFQNSYTNQKGRQTATTFATMSAPAASSAAPAPTGAASDSASGASSGSSYSSGSNSTGGSTGQCSEDGALVCNGPSKFGICDHGSVVWQDVAAGTQCIDGAISAKSRFARRHAHFGGAHKH